MQKRDPRKIPLQLYWNQTDAQTHPQEITAHPQNISPQENTSGRLLLYVKGVLKYIIEELQKVIIYIHLNEFINFEK